MAVEVLLAAFVAFVLPGLVKSQAERRVEAASGRKLAIGRNIYRSPAKRGENGSRVEFELTAE